MTDLKSEFLEASRILNEFIASDAVFQKMESAGNMLTKAFHAGNKVISCGNGGSMCDAMHFAEELSGRFRGDRPPLPAISISDPAHISCVANDYGYEHVFSRYITAVGKPGDVLFAISTSGNSKNIIMAIEAAKAIGMKVIGLTGKSGGAMATQCDIEIRAPHSNHSDRAQEIHIKVIHALVLFIESTMFLKN